MLSSPDRVTVKNLILGDRSSGGGSTLTQQLVQNLYLCGDFGIFSIPVTEMPPVPSLALSTGEASLLEITRVCQAVANGGIAREPVYIKRIGNRDGRVI